MPSKPRQKVFVARVGFRQGRDVYEQGDVLPHDHNLALRISLGFAVSEPTPQPAVKATALKEAQDATG